MPISKKSWAVVGGTATAFALAPLAAVTIPSVLDEPVGSRGVVVAAAVPGPADDSEPAAGPGTADAGDSPTVSPASPSTPRSAVDTASTAVTPPTPVSPVTAESPTTAKSPVSPKSPVSQESPDSPKSPDTAD